MGTCNPDLGVWGLGGSWVLFAPNSMGDGWGLGLEPPIYKPTMAYLGYFGVTSRLRIRVMSALNLQVGVGGELPILRTSHWD